MGAIQKLARRACLQERALSVADRTVRQADEK